MQRKKNASEFTRHPSGHSAKPLTPNSLKQTRAFVITVRVTALSAITEELIMKLNIDLGKYVITGTKHDLILNEKRKVTDEKAKISAMKFLYVAVTTASLSIWLKSYAIAKFWRQKHNHFRSYRSILKVLV